MNTFSRETYVARRNALKKKLGKGRVLLLGNDESSMNYKDNWYHFRQDSTFLYYFGLDQPGLAAIIDIDSDEEIIFGDELTIEDIIWTGRLPKLSDLAESVGVSKTVPSSKLIKYSSGDLLYLPPYRAEHSVKIGAMLGMKPRKVDKRYSNKLIRAITQQRLYKSEEEVDQMNQAVIISNRMHLEVMKHTRPGLKEHELVAVAAKVAYDHNVHFAYPPILTKHGEVLHNHYHGNTLEFGDLVLFDGGTESTMRYAGDITRTFPVNGKFDSRQRALYDIVYKSFKEAVDALKPGIRFLDIHLLAAKEIVDGLKEMGIMKGNSDDAVHTGAHTMFFQCGLGHLIGLDVHDMENFGEENIGYTNELKKSTKFGLKSLRLGRELEKGFAVTVEPGIYIVPELIDLRRSQNKYKDFINYDELEKYRDFGGIRLEDNFVITHSGSKLLGIEMPQTAEEIEAAVGQ